MNNVVVPKVTFTYNIHNIENIGLMYSKIILISFYACWKPKSNFIEVQSL
jgi:hypothetical protein